MPRNSQNDVRRCRTQEGIEKMRAGVIGLGDMGSGLAKNLIKNGFETVGFDLSERRMEAFAEMGGAPASGTGEVGRKADAVFVMVMNGDQAKEVILGKDGLVQSMESGSAVILTATITAEEVRDIARDMAGSGIDLIDSPVSGGFPGAQGGTLTLMAAAPTEVLGRSLSVLEAVSGSIHHVGDEPGMGQTVKACLQALQGAIFAATFEAAALAAKAGISGQVIHNVVGSSGASCGVVNTALENIIDRKFVGTGSHIATMHKDLTIALGMARDLGVPLFMAGNAMQLFQAGKTKHPEGDNWVVTRVVEDIIGAELVR
ncbi:MAG: NAD(P)-dependent oxidoreductase [Pseudomonadota bacterium]